jgi:hypothetical protein
MGSEIEEQLPAQIICECLSRIQKKSTVDEGQEWKRQGRTFPKAAPSMTSTNPPGRSPLLDPTIEDTPVSERCSSSLPDRSDDVDVRGGASFGTNTFASGKKSSMALSICW